MKKLLLLLALTTPFLAHADIEATRALGGVPSQVEAVLMAELEREGLEKILAKEAAHRLLLPEIAGVSAETVIRSVVVTHEIEKLRAGGGDPVETRLEIERHFRSLGFTEGEAEFMARKTLAVPRTLMSVRRIVSETAIGPKPVSGRGGLNVREFRPRARPR